MDDQANNHADVQGTNSGYRQPPKEYRWKPGQSGNPAGRPKSALLSDAIRHLLPQPYRKTGKSYAQMIAETLCKRAVNGDVAAIRELLDRTEGRARQSLDMTVQRGEEAEYEAMIIHLMTVASQSNLPITREKAIQLLAVHNPEIHNAERDNDGS